MPVLWLRWPVLFPWSTPALYGTVRDELCVYVQPEPVTPRAQRRAKLKACVLVEAHFVREAAHDTETAAQGRRSRARRARDPVVT